MAEIWSDKVRCLSRMKLRLRAEWVVLSEDLCIMTHYSVVFNQVVVTWSYTNVFGRPFVKRFALRYRSIVCLSVSDVGVLCPNGWMDQDETWHGGRPRARPHCVTWGPEHLLLNDVIDDLLPYITGLINASLQHDRRLRSKLLWRRCLRNQVWTRLIWLTTDACPTARFIEESGTRRCRWAKPVPCVKWSHATTPICVPSLSFDGDGVTACHVWCIHRGR